ncbi:MAG TPA: hypothetical protein VLZ31_03070 [Microbacteriaceae bacterium]|nr:hypothetical protein [Microbacteriaceae bacterium]
MNKQDTKNSGDLIFSDVTDLQDLSTMLRRLETVGTAEIIFQTVDQVLSVYGCTQEQGGLLNKSNTVLVHRAYRLEEGSIPTGRATMPIRSVLDRLARLEASETVLKTPESSLFVSWGGQLPRREGWRRKGELNALSLKKVAQQGMERIAGLLPADAGAPVVEKIRKSVWDLEIAPKVPAGAAFALETLGFLDDVELVVLSVLEQWTRLSSKQGDVIVRGFLTQ